MSTTARDKSSSSIESVSDSQDLLSTKKVSLIIGQEEFIKINISNKLDGKFNYNVLTKDTIEGGIELITNAKIDLIILDIDQISYEAIGRVYKLLNHLQTPCLFVGSDSSFLNKLRVDMDTSFVSFLPKTILNSMFNDTLHLLLNKTNPGTKVSKRFVAAGESPKSNFMYFLGISLLLEPIIKVFYLKLQTGFDWEILSRTIFGIEGIVSNFEFWALFPLAGYALLSVRSWSFFFFISLQAYSLFAFFTYEKFTWPYVAETPHISSTFLLIFNSALVFYFMAPANRRPFWNKTRNLWRNTSRYATSLRTQYKLGSNKITTTVTNISETGAYFTTTKSLPIGHKMQIDIPINGEVKSIDAIVRRSQDTAHEKYFGYGIEFDYKTKADKVELKEFIHSLNHRIQ